MSISPRRQRRSGSTWEPRGEKVAGAVARQIVRDIVDRGLGPNTALEPESVMLKRYQVSRASLREALRILEIQGLIRIKPGPKGGPSVCEVDSRDFGRMATLFFQVQEVRMSELVEARLILEPLMAGLAAKRKDPTDLKELQQIVQEGFDADTDAEWLEASDAFHAIVLSMSGNRLLDLVARALKDIYTDRTFGLIFGNRQHDRIKQVHAEIAEAIVGGDAERAEELTRDHMSEYARQIAKRHPDMLNEIVDWR